MSFPNYIIHILFKYYTHETEQYIQFMKCTVQYKDYNILTKREALNSFLPIYIAVCKT